MKGVTIGTAKVACHYLKQLIKDTLPAAEVRYHFRPHAVSEEGAIFTVENGDVTASFQVSPEAILDVKREMFNRAYNGEPYRIVKVKHLVGIVVAEFKGAADDAL